MHTHTCVYLALHNYDYFRIISNYRWNLFSSALASASLLLLIKLLRYCLRIFQLRFIFDDCQKHFVSLQVAELPCCSCCKPGMNEIRSTKNSFFGDADTDVFVVSLNKNSPGYDRVAANAEQFRINDKLNG